MSFGKFGNTFRGQTLDQIQAQAPIIVNQLDDAMYIPDETERRAEIHRLFDTASHNQRLILTEAAIELLIQYPMKRSVK